MEMLLQPPAVRICGLEMCPSSVRISLLRKFRVLRFWHRWVAFAGQTVFCGPFFTTGGHISTACGFPHKRQRGPS